MENEDKDKNEEKNKESAAGGNGEEQQRTFTQAEVDEIIRRRLTRAKADAAADEEAISSRVNEELEKALGERESKLKARETALECKSYLIEKGYPVDLLEALDTSDLDSFKSKAEIIMRVKQRGNRTAPLGSGEPVRTGKEKTPLDLAFSAGVKHKPKPYPEPFDG